MKHNPNRNKLTKVVLVFTAFGIDFHNTTDFIVTLIIDYFLKHPREKKIYQRSAATGSSSETISSVKDQTKRLIV